MTLVRAAAIVYLACSVGIIGFQLALAFGAPLGAYAMGGGHGGTLPGALRVAEVLQAAMVGLLAAVVVATSGAGLQRWRRGAERARWLPALLARVSFVLNLASPSPGERLVWAPVAAVLTATSLCVALRAPLTRR